MWCKKKKPTRTDTRRTVSDVKIPENHETSYKVWIQGAENIHQTENIKMRTRGEHKYGYPEGIIVHWDSGWALKKGMFWNPFPLLQAIAGDIKPFTRQKALQCAELGVKNGYLYLVMDLLGKVYQSRPLTKWGYHAGKSHWTGLGYSVSSKLVGIEVKSPGKVRYLGSNKYKTWFGQVFDKSLVRTISKTEDNIEKGHYVMFTKEQEDSIVNLCCNLWMGSPKIDNKRVFKIKYILGHDSVSPSRKTDPGGSLSMTIPKLQEAVRKELIVMGFGDEDLT